MKEPLYDREGMARMIRTYFIEHKTKLSPCARYRPNPRHDTQENWLKAADVCIANSANPADWVAASFALSKGTLFANQLAGPSAIGRWKEFVGRGVDPVSRQMEAKIEANQTKEERVTPRLVGVIEDSQLMIDIKNEFILAHVLLHQATGSAYAKDNHKFLADRYTSIRPHIRVAIAGRAGMQDIVIKFRDMAAYFLKDRPHHTECLTILGYDMRTYLNVT